MLGIRATWRGSLGSQAPPPRFDALAGRPTTALHQRVEVAGRAFDVHLEGDLLVRAQQRSGGREHLLSTGSCSCGFPACDARHAVALARSRGFAAFLPLNPTEAPVDPRTVVSIPLAEAEHAFVRADAWGDRVEILVSGSGIERHVLAALGRCEQDHECKGQALLSGAIREGLVPFVPHGDAYVYTQDDLSSRWAAPFGMAPRLGPSELRVDALGRARWLVTERRRAEYVLRLVEDDWCDCGRKGACLHRQIIARTMGIR